MRSVPIFESAQDNLDELANMLGEVSISEKPPRRIPEGQEVKERREEGTVIIERRKAQENIGVQEVENALKNLTKEQPDVKDFQGVQETVLKCLGLKA
jgi:hypothetical protein